MPSRSVPAPSRAEHLRQLKKVFGPLSPGFVAQELACSVEQATVMLYGSSAGAYCWVRLSDLAWLSGLPQAEVEGWVRRHHLPCLTIGPRRLPTALLIHVADGQRFLQGMPFPQPEWADLPRFRAPIVKRAPKPVHDPEVDWRLAQGAAWPVTAERLAEALYGTRSAVALGQVRRLVRLWEAQGRVVCFARGLYDRVRPEIILDPSLFGRSVLPKAEIQALQDHHPEVRHWSSRALAAAWRAYSRLYGAALLPVLARREPTFLEYLLVRQLNPAEPSLQLDVRYEAWCQEAALYRLIPAPSGEVPLVTVENIEAGRLDFQALAKATREQLQLRFENNQAGRGRVARVKD